MSELPRFAVVGHPNKGKSSVVSALTQQDQVAISELSGTTTVAQSFTLNIDGEALYELIDTPGFQRPRQMLECLLHSKPNASERLDAIKYFITDQDSSAQTSGRFKDEIELLGPIVNGASIIYVVDGSIPYTPEYEAEMTILQWTGQPRMALINPISGEQYVDQWRQALSQYFSLVRTFDPMSVNSEQQRAILAAFEELNPAWKAPLINAQKIIVRHNGHLQEQSAYLIAQYMTEVLSHTIGLPLSADGLRSVTEQTLKKQYQHWLTSKEDQLQRDIKALYAHDVVQTQRLELMLNYPDLFDQGHWYLFGLSRTKLIALAASGGATAGAVLDLGLGGASLLAGTLLGGIGSAAASFYFTEAPEKIRVRNIPMGGKKLLIGPVKNLQFAFVLLGRAVNFQQAISQHSHASRAPVAVGESTHWLDNVDKKLQVRVTQLLQKGQKGLSNSDLNTLQNTVSALLNAAPGEG